MKGTDGKFRNNGYLKYYRDANGMRITICVNSLGMEDNKNKMVSIIGYIGIKTLRKNPKTRLVVK